MYLTYEYKLTIFMHMYENEQISQNLSVSMPTLWILCYQHFRSVLFILSVSKHFRY